MRTEFQDAIAAAGRLQDASSMVMAIKRAVASEIRAADPSASVTFTDYFNHTFVPDIVLRWPTESRERLVYVRPNPSDQWLLNGIAYVSAHKPMVFTLEDLAPAGQDLLPDDSRRKLTAQALATDTWITDPSGVAAVSSVRAKQPYLGLLSQALVRGGRGVSGPAEITDLAEKTEAGFTASRELSEPDTRLAVQAIEGSLDAEQSGRLTRVLRAVWEGHGGASSKFPTASSVGTLTDDDLSYLLSAMEQAPIDFWRRIGRTLTTAQLGRVRVDDPSQNLHALVSANLDSLQARGLRVVDEPFRLGESDKVPRWVVAKGCLALRGLNWTAYIAARRTEEMPPPDDAPVPDLPELRRRAFAGRAPITQVQFGRNDRAVTYESKDGTDVLDDPGLQQAAADLKITAVEKAVATIEGDRNVGIDFGQKTAIGPTNAIFPLGSLMRSVLPLISDLEEDELRMLHEALESAASSGELFGQ
ncbi:MAG: hypothetical protein JO345_06955 [Streptosporangiaceae bacterium]|nr:hypothetical protein [Streptosporangiaceae bacterium]